MWIDESLSNNDNQIRVIRTITPELEPKMKKQLMMILLLGSLSISSTSLTYAQGAATAPASQPASQPATAPASQPTTSPASKPAADDAASPEAKADAATVDARGYSNVDKKGVGLSGYDAVSYFDGTPKKGNSKFQTTYQNVVYQFTNQANLDKFVANPEKFAPAYGGWCAYAMVDGEKVDVDPKTFKIVDEKLFLYYNGLFGNTKEKWNEKDEAAQVKSADSHWADLTKSH